MVWYVKRSGENRGERRLAGGEGEVCGCRRVRRRSGDDVGQTRAMKRAGRSRKVRDAVFGDGGRQGFLVVV